MTLAIFSEKKKDVAVKETHAHAPVPAVPSAGVVIPGILVKGEIQGKGDIKIEGVVEGKINLEGLVTIGSRGEVKGEVMGINVTVAGKVDGNIKAKEKAEIQASGQIHGDISAARIMVAEGALIIGAVKISKHGEKPAGSQ